YFIITIQTVAGIRDVDDMLTAFAAAVCASRAATGRRVIPPAAVPLILPGIRFSVGRAVKGMINGEMFIALIGLRGLAAKYGGESNFPSVWAMAVFIMVIAVILNEFVNWAEKRLTAWYA